ncbi:MAG: insulinase family protein [Opitutaceae bacterium]
MRHLSAIFLALVLSWSASGSTDAVSPAATSDLPSDPAVHYGQLPNGMRYAVMANHEPRERAALRLLVEAGSLNEKENQRGLAHFLEHMAFNGSEHYPPGTLIEFFQRMGMSFGGDTNAYTSFDVTVYMVDLPNTKPETIGEGLRVFRDYAGGLLLGDEELDHERGVILSEKRTRDSVEFRSYVAEMDFLLDGSLFPRRMPIGEEEIIQTAPREAFVDFYDTWYRPELMTVVAVGDFDVAEMEAQITAAFSDLQPRGPVRTDPDLGVIAEREGLSILYHPEPEAGSTTVAIQTVTPYVKEPDTAENRIRQLPRDLALAILNRRLAELAKTENAPFLSGRSSVFEGYDFFRNASIELTGKPERWDEALALADVELRRALQYGFQQPELTEVVAAFRNGLEQAVKQAPTRRSAGLAGQIVDAVSSDEVFTTPEFDLALLGPVLEAVTADDCLAALREAWDVPHRFVSVIGNARIEGDADATIAAVFSASQSVAVDPPAVINEVPFAYTSFGEAGEVDSRTEVDDLEITQVVFANGVRLNLKKTDFEAGKIIMSVRLGGGKLSEPADKPGLALLAGNVFTQGGLGAHSSDELRRILAGRNVGVGFSVGDDAFGFSGATTPEDLLLQLQLTTAYITDPGYRPEADRQIRKGIEQYYTRLAHVPDGPLQLEVARRLASGDSRFGMPLQEEIDQRTMAEVASWLGPDLESGPIEIALAGDLEVDAAIEAVGQTLGALPPREAKPAYTKERQVHFPAETFSLDYQVPTEIPKGVVALYWPTTDARDVHVSRRLAVLANVLTDRLRIRIREELGGAYSPFAASNASDTYEKYGYITARITVEPEKAQEIAGAVVELAASLAADGVGEDELERAREPILTSLRESARTNGYWIGAVLGSAQEFPQRLDWSRSRYSDFGAITASEIDVLAQAYLGPDKCFQVIVLPESVLEPAGEEIEAAAEVGAE